MPYPAWCRALYTPLPLSRGVVQGSLSPICRRNGVPGPHGARSANSSQGKDGTYASCPSPFYLGEAQGLWPPHGAHCLHLEAEWGEASAEEAECIQEAMKRQGELWVGPGLPPISFLHDREHPIDTIWCFTSFACRYVLGISPRQFMETFIVLFHSCIVLSCVAAPWFLQLPYQGTQVVSNILQPQTMLQ